MKRIITIFTAIFLTGAVFGAIMVKPPVDLKNVPLKSALEIVFGKTGVSFEVDKNLKFESGQKVTLYVGDETQLDFVLKLILDPKGLVYEVDNKGIYHIRKKGSAPRKADLALITVEVVVQNVVGFNCEGKTYYAIVGQVLKARDKSIIPGYPNLKLKTLNVKNNIIVLENDGKTYEIAIKKVAPAKPKPPAKSSEKPAKK